jgi:hypothetical protein
MLNLSLVMIVWNDRTFGRIVERVSLSKQMRLTSDNPSPRQGKRAFSHDERDGILCNTILALN